MSPLVFRTLLIILANLNNTLVWMVSARPPISNSSSPLTKPLRRVPGAPIKFGITVTFMLQSFLVLRQGLSTCLSFSLIFTLWSVRFSSFFFFFFFLLIITRSITIILMIIYSLRVFLGLSWWSFTEIWVTASLFKPSGLFSVFWLFSIM